MAADSTPTSMALARPCSEADPPLLLQLTQAEEDTPASSKAQPQQQRPAAVDLQLEAAFEGFSGSPALQQMSHLGVYLQDCDDGRRQAEMIEVRTN